WRYEACRPLAQMVREAPPPVPEGREVAEPGASQQADAIGLTALVYPHYFRRRTADLRRYCGSYVVGRPAAMVGERLGPDDTRELSAICTHPDFTGRGYARRVTAMLANDNLERGCLPFLHVSHENTRALELYAKLGFRHRADIGFWSLRRP